MISSNGKFPAGTVNVPLVENGKLRAPDVYQNCIEKCPDREAKLVYRLELEMMRTVKR